MPATRPPLDCLLVTFELLLSPDVAVVVVFALPLTASVPLVATPEVETALEEVLDRTAPDVATFVVMVVLPQLI